MNESPKEWVSLTKEMYIIPLSVFLLPFFLQQSFKRFDRSKFELMVELSLSLNPYIKGICAFLTRIMW